MPLLFPVSRVKRDLLEVGISGHGADRCDQDDEIYLMVQEIWSGSEIFGVKRFQRERRRRTSRRAVPVIGLSARNGWGHGAIAWGNLHIFLSARNGWGDDTIPL